jgi:hypothetical protein
MVETVIPKIDTVDLAGRLLYIVDKRGQVVPFKFNAVQRYFHTNKSKRNIVLKARQVGISTSILADMFISCTLIPYLACAVVSHETRATQRLLDKVQFYYDSMEEPKPVLDAESRSEKVIQDTHSSIYIGTCGARAFSRGDTVHKAHLSEIAFYEDGERILSGIQDAVPLEWELNLESTANGENNVFYDTWVKAREGKNPYKPFFFPWWWEKEYRIPRNPQDPDILNLLQPSDRGELTYTDEEQFLITTHHLDEDQMRWRRFKLSEKGGLFFVEYPENDVDCFITVGDPVFDQTLLTDLANSCYDGEKHPYGWTYWLPPIDKMNYVIGADTSSGAPEGSYSAAVVMDSLWRVCATFQARLEPHQFADVLRKMATWYNKAEIAVERNFTGYAVLEQLANYPNITHQRDFTTGKITTQRGWWSNDQTRSMMMTVTRENLPKLKVWDSNVVRQLRSYRYVKLKTKYREQAQTYDDLSLALMITITVKKTAGVARGYQGSYNNWNW